MWFQVSWYFKKVFDYKLFVLLMIFKLIDLTQRLEFYTYGHFVWVLTYVQR